MLAVVRREYHGGIVLNSRTFACLVRDADLRRQARRDFATALLAEHQVNHLLAVLRGNQLSAAGGGEETSLVVHGSLLAGIAGQVAHSLVQMRLSEPILFGDGIDGIIPGLGVPSPKLIDQGVRRLIGTHGNHLREQMIDFGGVRKCPVMYALEYGEHDHKLDHTCRILLMVVDTDRRASWQILNVHLPMAVIP